MLRWFFITLGTASVVGGILIIWTPVPLGLPLLMIGIPLLMKYSPTARKSILSLACRYPKVHDYLKNIQLIDDTRDSSDKQL